MGLKISRAFKDISLSFSRHPVTNDILVLKNEDAIKKTVINLVRTRIGERFFNSLLGTSIADALFELADLDYVTLYKEEIYNVLRNFEPRVRVNNVEVQIEDDTYDLNIRIQYDIIGLPFPAQEIEFLLQPTRI
jgi:phage baseplate assembly protein W